MSLSLPLLVAAGALEGYAFYRSGIFLPAAVTDQMLFKRFILMKVFFSGVGFSMIFQALLQKYDPVKFNKSRTYGNDSYGYVRPMLGCTILGMGMAIAGSGPTMIPAQLAGGVESAKFTLAGAILGGSVYALLEKYGLINLNFVKAGQNSHTLEKKVGGTYPQLSVAIGSALIAATLGLEALFPAVADANGLGLGWAVLPPIVAGLAVGFGQIPTRLISEDGQGGSTSIMNIVSTLTGGFLSPRHKITGAASLYQFAYVYGGTLLGAYLARSSNLGPVADLVGFSPAQCVLGGALMLFGARVAGGCTCGHGISGFSELSLESIAASMCIFAGGIGTSVAMSMF